MCKGIFFTSTTHPSTSPFYFLVCSSIDEFETFFFFFNGTLFLVKLNIVSCVTRSQRLESCQLFLWESDLRYLLDEIESMKKSFGMSKVLGMDTNQFFLGFDFSGFRFI